jgi:hypothetical protein
MQSLLLTQASSVSIRPQKVATAALLQAGVDKAQLFWALIRLVKIDTPIVKDLEQGKRSGTAVIRSFITVAVRE